MNPQKKRFWAKVDISGDCWLWKAWRKPSGYGQFRFNGINMHAHRVAWMLTNGNIPEGMCVLHRCDNPPCCNPDHLRLGTQQENIADRDSKGRHKALRGEEQGSSKLNDDSIREIRTLYATGLLSQKDLADGFGVSQATVSSIVLRKSWGHVK